MRIDNKLASAHLKALKDVSLASTRRDGKRIYYSLAGSVEARLGVTRCGYRVMWGSSHIAVARFA